MEYGGTGPWSVTEWIINALPFLSDAAPAAAALWQTNPVFDSQYSIKNIHFLKF